MGDTPPQNSARRPGGGGAKGGGGSPCDTSGFVGWGPGGGGGGMPLFAKPTIHAIGIGGRVCN